jgi:hypothetical protein
MRKKTPFLQLLFISALTTILLITTFISISSAQKQPHVQVQTYSSTTDYASEVEKKIRSGEITTADLIVDEHPRLWINGNWDWDPNNYGSFAWRILHGEAQGWPWGEDPANDQEKAEFRYCTGSEHGGAYGADEMYQNYDHDYGRRVLEPIIAGKAQKLDWSSQWRGGSDWDYNLDHTADEYLADAREKLQHVSNYNVAYEYPYVVTLFGSVAYDWLVEETYTNGSPVLSEEDKQIITERLMAHADYLMDKLSDSINVFNSPETDTFYFGMVGMALYEPSAGADYASINTKAKEYLDAFDQIVDVLAIWNEQGGDGGWHGGLSNVGLPFYNGGSRDSEENAGIIALAPVLYAHYTATGVPIHESLFNTGVLRNFAEFQVHMIRPTEIQSYDAAPYYEINGAAGEFQRAPWIAAMRAYSRRRFSSEAEQQRIGELGGWIRTSYSKRFTDAGSWDTLDQLLFEDKWANPRPPDEIGFDRTRHFEKLGWVFMRSGFTSPNDMAALFISQRYHWSDLNTYSQNSFTLERKGKLIEGFQNSIYIDGEYQRLMANYPTLADGIEAYAPGSVYDVGPGILAFETNDTYDYMLGDATNAYAPSKLSEFTRQVVYLKPDILVIFDRVLTTDIGIEKKWIVDPAALPQDQGNNLITVDNGSGALWIKRLLPSSALVSLSDTEIAVVPSQSGTETFFLHVMQAVDSGASAGQVAADDAIVTQEGDWFHVQVADRKISFSKSGEFEFDGQSTTLRGDVNLDGIVDTLDIQLSVDVFLEFETDPAILGRADLNNDGVVNSLDIQEIFLESNK